MTQHNDISRTGQNTNETILTPANVNSTNFGKLFSHPVDGYIYAQPLYVPGLTMGAGTPQAGTIHNVIFIATEHDSIYAFDADNNLGANANPLWQITLLDSAHGAVSGATTVSTSDVNTADITPEIGVTGTPVIDPATNTLYVVGKTKESGTFVQRLHALDLTTGLEKFGAPATLSASVPGNGNGSSGGTLNWDPEWENQRPGLLLLNGIVYLGFGAHGDNGPWHGWILAYNASTLAQTGAWCASPNGLADGIWMSGSGLAASVPDPAGHPFGRMLTSTGNGSHSAPINTTVPLVYNNTMNYGDSIIKLDLANGVPTMNSNGTVVGDDFTPHDQATLASQDTDQASGGVLLLPDEVGGGKHLLAQLGKTGRIYILDQDNLGGYNPNNTSDSGQKASVDGLWGMPAYWNGNLFVWSVYNNLMAFSIHTGTLSSTFTSRSAEYSSEFSPTPAVSANGTTNGIVWSIRSDNFNTQGREILYAHDASNVAKLLYSSENNVGRDNPGNSVKFIVPTVINGKVYFGSEAQVNVFGLLNGATQAATPVIAPVSQSFNPSLQVTITESTAGTTVYYTADDSQPTTASTVYAGPFTITSTTTIKAMAAGTGHLQSPVASATYMLVTQVATPTFTPAPGIYTAVQSVTISTTTPNAAIFYTTDGTMPGTSVGGSTQQFSGPVSIGATETLKAIATAPNLSSSPAASGLYTINLNASSVSFGSGFTAGNLILNGGAAINGTKLRLTDGGGSEGRSAFFNTPLNVQSFVNDFSFQLTNANADGFTFTIQGIGPTALGSRGGGLGYTNIGSSVAVGFQLYSSVLGYKEVSLTGDWTNGAPPDKAPGTDTTGSGVNIHSGDVMSVHMTYDGTTLTWTITDTTTGKSFTKSVGINIPASTGNTAYVGFTGGDGGLTAVQDVLTWTYTIISNSPLGPSIATPPANETVTVGQTATFSVVAGGTAPLSYQWFQNTGTGFTAISGANSSSYTTPATTGNNNGNMFEVMVTNSAGSVTSNSATLTVSSTAPSINFLGGFTSAGLMLNGATINGTRLRLTDGAGSEVRSAFFTTPVNVQSFTSDFTFQLTNANADGFTFTIQNQGATAKGTSTGGSLGYNGIQKAACIEFDIFNNTTSAPAQSSTGYVGTANVPAIGPINLNSSSVNISGGHVMAVHVAYDGTTLTWTVKDQSTGASATSTQVVNIPSVVGANTAYVGFTGATGGLTATQEILTWAYTQ